MNRYAYKTAGLAVGALSGLFRARFRIHGEEKIPQGPKIYVINHFTRIETVYIPYYIHKITGRTVWSLADAELFEGGLGIWLERLGAVSTKDPHRDRLMVKTLLTGEADWIIFPEGRMVKNKQVIAKGKKGESFLVAGPDGLHPPHTGAATLGLRSEFYRERIHYMADKKNMEEVQRLREMFGITGDEPVTERKTMIVPVNLTYYPIRSHENMISRMAEKLVGDLSPRMAEELMTEGTMLLSGIDVDMRFGDPIPVANYLKAPSVTADIRNPSPIGFDDPIPSQRMLRKTARRIMERYMSAIYRMTTVNHDHIIATLVTKFPGAAIRETDLRFRTYLACSLDFDRMEIFCHDSLSQEQSSILTDDRYGRLSNFIDFAVERKVLQKKGGWIEKTYASAGPEEYHQVRANNPVAVMANEIAVLTDLVCELERIALMPSLRVRYTLRRFLWEKMNLEFEKDYTRYYKEGESKGREIGAPFLLKGKRCDTGVLLVHGYMAAPAEVRALGDFLESLGYMVIGPRVRGHGTSPEDLAARTWNDWVVSVEQAYGLLAASCRRIVCGGFSAGAGLAMDISLRVKRISGLFAISPPMKLHDFSARFVPPLHYWNRLMDKVGIESAKKTFVENHPENPHINYTRNPLSGVMELGRLMDSVDARLGEIQVPVLLVQGFGDPVVDYNGALRIFERLGSTEKRLLFLNRDRHGIINGPGSSDVFTEVAAFMKRIERAEAHIRPGDQQAV